MSWKPDRKRLTDQVVDQLKWSILKGKYKAGERLPAERALSEELGVTRLTLREALKSTEAAGFTQTRHGQGTTVCDVWENASLQILGEILGAGQRLTTEQVESFLEFREVVCPGFAPALAKNCTDQDVDALFEIIAQEREKSENEQELWLLDYDFQRQLAHASGNFVFALLMQSVKPAYMHLSRVVFEKVRPLSAIVDGHEAIATAIRSHNAEEVAKQITQFVAAGNTIVRQALESGALTNTSHA